MTIDPSTSLGFDPVTGQPASPAPPAPAPAVDPKHLIAPWWHTIVIVIIILVNSYIGATKLSTNIQHRGRIVLYLSTIVTQFVLLGLVWFGLRLKKTKMRDLIGGRWNRVEDFLLDIAIAAGFWLVSALILAGIKLALGLATLDVNQSAEQVKKAVGSITPRTLTELGVFVLLAVVAGIVEEIIFRGYLQRQIGAITGNVYAGLVIAAIIFGAGHGYQGTRFMILIAIYGALFGTLVLLRKSLRPGMMAHAWQDAFSGILIYLLTKMGKM
jgi:membrane protease YdiL (CAAX protease family)